MSISLQVIVSNPTPDAMAYARALERRGARAITPDEARVIGGMWTTQRMPYVLAEPVPYVITRPHARTEWAAEYAEHMDLPTINASRVEVPGRRALQLPMNPPEFSRRLVDLVVERAMEIVGAS